MLLLPFTFYTIIVTYIVNLELFLPELLCFQYNLESSSDIN